MIKAPSYQSTLSVWLIYNRITTDQAPDLQRILKKFPAFIIRILRKFAIIQSLS